MIGKVIGKLTVVEFKEIRNRLFYWECKCECGNFTSRSTGDLNRSLKKGRFVGCRSCAQKNNRKNDNGESSWKQYRNSYLYRARNRSLKFELSIEEFKDICSKDCHYCGSSPRMYNRYKKSDLTNRDKNVSEDVSNSSWIKVNGIDRRDNSVGYVLSNCLTCCSSCNRMKGTLDYYDFIARCGNVYLTRKLDK